MEYKRIKNQSRGCQKNNLNIVCNLTGDYNRGNVFMGMRFLSMGNQ